MTLTTASNGTALRLPDDPLRESARLATDALRSYVDGLGAQGGEPLCPSLVQDLREHRDEQELLLSLISHLI